MYKLLNSVQYVQLRQHYYPTRARENLREPSHHVTFLQHSLPHTGPRVWNSTPNHIRDLSSLHSFKIKIQNVILLER